MASRVRRASLCPSYVLVMAAKIFFVFPLDKPKRLDYLLAYRNHHYLKGVKKMKIKTWKFDQIWDEARARNIYIEGEYVDGQLDRESVTCREVLSETEKAIRVVLNAETVFSGRATTWTTWIPKSAIISA